MDRLSEGTDVVLRGRRWDAVCPIISERAMTTNLIEAYYAVAAHLSEQADRAAATAAYLAKIADEMSEARMPEKQPAPESET
jgi:hypothetical protein